MTSEGAFEHAMRVIRRRWLIIVVAIVTVPLVAFLYSESQTKEYTASATLLFETRSESAEEETRQITTNEALAVLPQVAAKAAKELGASVGEVLSGIEVSAGNEMANLSTISATNPSPERAAEIANAYSKAYIDFRREAKQAPLRRAIAAIEASLAELSPVTESAKADALNEELSKLEIQDALQTGEASIVQQAEPPGSPSKPKTKRNVLIGFLLGVVLAAVLAALIDRADKRIRSTEEMEQVFGLPLIARIPKSKALDGVGPMRMLSSLDAEAFRTLRTNLRYLGVNQDVSRILIASPEPSDGKSTVARGLAAAMAEGGEDVVLVEADLRKEGFFRSDPGYHGLGLSSVLAGTSLDSALLRIPVFSDASGEPRFLTVLPNGPVPPNPGELLESDRMREIVEDLAERFQAIVFDTPAFGVVSDSIAMVPLSTAVLALGGIGKTTRTAAREFIEQLSITHKRPLGLIVTMTGKNRAHYGYYRPSGPTASSRGLNGGKRSESGLGSSTERRPKRS